MPRERLSLPPAVRQERADIEALMRSREFKRFCLRHLRVLGIDRSVATASAHDTAISAGQQRAGFLMLDRLKAVVPKAHLLLLEEGALMDAQVPAEPPPNGDDDGDGYPEHE